MVPRNASAAPDLPQRLREATRALHAAAERSALMVALLSGRLPRPRYLMLLRSLHALYEALEAGLERLAPDPAIATLDASALRRAPALAADLQALHGPGWRTALAPVPAAQAYAARLSALAATGSRTLVAHAYVRYLGDLNGGQLLRRRVAQGLALSGDEGTQFYDFGGNAAVLRDRLRGALGRLPLSPDEQDAVVAEACWAFDQHRQMFEEISG